MNCFQFCFSFAFNFILRRYIMAMEERINTRLEKLEHKQRRGTRGLLAVEHAPRISKPRCGAGAYTRTLLISTGADPVTQNTS